MTKVDEKAFEAFMLAYHEHGGTGLGFRECLEAYENAKTTPEEVERVGDAIAKAWGLKYTRASLNRAATAAIKAMRGM